MLKLVHFMKKIWERDLGSTGDEDTWDSILSNNGLYIREARIQNL